MQYLQNLFLKKKYKNEWRKGVNEKNIIYFILKINIIV